MIEKYSKKAGRLALWMEDNMPDGLGVFAMPEKHRRRLRTTNMVERQNREIKRRTRVSGLFPNETSLPRLVSAILMKVSENWESADKAYLKLQKSVALSQIRLRGMNQAMTILINEAMNQAGERINLYAEREKFDLCGRRQNTMGLPVDE